MNSLLIVEPGFQTTVQDLGRFGYAHLGVSASGAADALALRAANLLVGNSENAPALEMTLTGVTVRFERAAVIALTGSDFGAGSPLWKAVDVSAGALVRCGAALSGARGYLAVRGGIDAAMVLGSASVHLASGVGGRALKAGDVLRVGDGAVRRARSGALSSSLYEGPLRVTAGPQAAWFGQELFDSVYQVGEASNRMGIRLVGTAIPSPPGRMVTEGVALGAIQIPPDGQPIILFVEHQTTGGYPKPANVISADLCRVGQLRPRDTVRFEPVTLAKARELRRAQEEWIYSILSME